MNFSITLPELPGAHFASQDAVEAHGYTATRLENVIAAFELDGDQIALANQLTALGFEREEIEWVIQHPGERPAIGYATAADLPAPDDEEDDGGATP